MINSRGIFCNILAGKTEYIPNYLFVEYMNVENAADAVTDTFDVANPDGYYQGLTTGKDYLMLPVVFTPQVSEDNTVSYVVMAPATGTGAHNTPFSVSDNSKVYAISLVSVLNTAEPDAAIIFHRTSYPAEQQFITGSDSFTINWTVSVT